MDSLWRVELLGSLRLFAVDRVVEHFSTRQTALLLAYLAYHSDRPCPRETLLELLWPETDPEAARNRLSTALSSLRRQLEPPGVPAGTVLRTTRYTLQLNPAACTTDVAAFGQARQAAEQTASALERAQRLAQAVAHYRGELLPGFYEEWVLTERERLAAAYLHALQSLKSLAEGAGDLEVALEWTRRAVAVDPLSEEARFDLVRLLAATGQTGAAITAYEEWNHLLKDEMGVTAGKSLRALAESIRTQPELHHQQTTTEPLPRQRKRSATVDTPLPLLAGTVVYWMAEVTEGHSSSAPADRFWRDSGDQITAQLRSICRGHGGHDMAGPAGTITVLFGRTSDAVQAAVTGHHLVAGAPSVRMALHVGEIDPGAADHRGQVFYQTMQLLLAAHPGQVLLSEEVAGLVHHELAPPLRLIDLGSYRLHGREAPERVLQLVTSETEQCRFPALNAPPALAGHLPLTITRFFGHGEEITRLHELLIPSSCETNTLNGKNGAHSCRLVTLTGMGGSGKTRLAVEVAAGLQPAYGGAVWFVSLAEVSDPRAIATAIREAVGLPAADSAEALECVITALTGQPALLLLDNFEQLAAEGCGVVAVLLQRLPLLRCLVTSRQPLGLTGEQVFPVLPLPTPPEEVTAEQCAQYPSVQLFVDRAQSVRPDFQVTRANAPALSTLCQQLEGIPLALELAAARAQTLTPGQMVEQLQARFCFLTGRRKDRPARHQSLRATLDWSYQHLTPPLQQFFARLSVFRGGWTLPAATKVCASAADGIESHSMGTLALLEELVDISLVQVEERAGEMRYRLLETLREYGAQQLEPEEQEALYLRHAEYFVELAEQAEPELRGPKQELWHRRLRAEADNLRAALTWCVESGHTEFGLRLVGALRWHPAMLGNFAEAWQHLAKMLQMPVCSSHEGSRRAILDNARLARARAKALWAAGRLMQSHGEPRTALDLFEQSLALWQHLGDRPGIAWSLLAVGAARTALGDLEQGRTSLEESLAIWREVGHSWGIAEALSNLGTIPDRQCDYPSARRLYEESLCIYRRLGDQRGIIWAANLLGQILQRQGDLPAACTLHEEGERLAREIHDMEAIIWSLQNLGHVARALGDLQTARTYFAAVMTRARAIGDRYGDRWACLSLVQVALDHGDLNTAQMFHNQSRALFEQYDDQEGIAYGALNLGRLSLARGDVSVALDTYRFALGLFRQQANRWGFLLTIELIAGAIITDIQKKLTSTGSPANRDEDAVWAARLFGVAQTLRDRLGAPLPPVGRADLERNLDIVRRVIGDSAFQQAWQAGRDATPEWVMEEVLLSEHDPR